MRLLLSMLTVKSSASLNLFARLSFKYNCLNLWAVLRALANGVANSLENCFTASVVLQFSLLMWRINLQLLPFLPRAGTFRQFFINFNTTSTSRLAESIAAEAILFESGPLGFGKSNDLEDVTPKSIWPQGNSQDLYRKYTTNSKN